MAIKIIVAVVVAIVIIIDYEDLVGDTFSVYNIHGWPRNFDLFLSVFLFVSMFMLTIVLIDDDDVNELYGNVGRKSDCRVSGDNAT